MKRSELNVGDELLYSRTNSWQTDDWSAAKAVVVSTEPCERVERWRGRGNETYRMHPQGRLVLVDLFYQRSNTPIRQPVSLAHLRGPYEDLKAKIEADREARAAEIKRQEQQREKRMGYLNDTITAARKAGIDVEIMASWKVDRAGYVAVPVEEMDRIVRIINARGQVD